MFIRNGEEIMTFRVYDSVGNCVNEFTGTMTEWQRTVAPKLTVGITDRDILRQTSCLN